MKIFDITVALHNGIPSWPGGPGFKLTQVSDMDKGAMCNGSQIACDVHIGTHVDAPWHFVKGAETIEQLDLNKLIGPCLVAKVSDSEARVTAKVLENLDLPAGVKRLLLKTRNSSKRALENSHFDQDFVALTEDASQWLVNRGIELIGIDYLSIQLFGDKARTHNILLEAKMVIVEGVNLVNVPQGEYELICLPMKLAGSDGAPARVILRK
jgi:arylformamidase